MKQINEESERMLIEAYNILNDTDVRGKRNATYLVNAMNAIQEALKQINTVEDETPAAKEE
jgi:hypothetical protein